MSLQRYSEVIAGYETLPDGSKGPPRYVAVPDNLPAARRQLYIRLAWWNDPMLLAWLYHLPVYESTMLVVLTPAGIIHRGTPVKLACGNVWEPSGIHQAYETTLAHATAEYVETTTDSGERTRGQPCQSCWPLGLLVAREPEDA